MDIISFKRYNISGGVFLQNDAIQEKLKQLPDSPGVYMMRSEGEIIYVGKAVSLKNRVRSYFTASKNHTAKVTAMVDKIDDFDIILCDTELEALVLENNLIKTHQPYYNILLKDGKTYPYICVDFSDPFPVLQVVRKVEKDGCKYFGPYFGANMIRDILDVVYETFPLRTCTRSMDRIYPRACIRYEIGLCPGPCIGACTREEYAQRLKNVLSFLSGDMKDIAAELTEKMNAFAKNMQYEQAALMRDRLKRIEQLSEKQQAFSVSLLDRDAIAIAAVGLDVMAQVMYVRSGRLVGSESYVLGNALDASPADVMRGFLLQHYDESSFIPREIIIESECSQKEAVEEILRKARGGAVSIVLPRIKSDRKQLAELAKKNAQESVQKRHLKMSREHERTLGACEDLGRALGIPAPRRIECYDISNFQGAQSVGSMVVATDGAADKKEYRMFRIKTVEGPDDFASIAEVITRRFSRLQKGDKSFSLMPDMVLIDGGKGQLSAAISAFNSLDWAGWTKLPHFFGLAEQFEEIFRPGESDPVIISKRSNALHLLQRIRDEAHRFALTRHQALRGKSTTASKLDGIPGIGPARKRALLAHFRSLKAISQAEVDELLQVKGMSRPSAQAVYDAFHR
jgi:excinuclease ABC subunit C